MKKIPFIFFVLILTACGTAAQPAVPQVTVILTPAPTFTASPTFTPTSTTAPLPTAPAEMTAEDLEKGKYGDHITFAMNEKGDGYNMLVDGVVAPDLNYWIDGKGVDLTYKGEKLAFSNVDVTFKPDGSTTFGPFERSASGEVSLIPGCTAEGLLAGESCGPGIKFVWENGNDNHLKFAETATKIRDLLMGDEIPEANTRAVADWWQAINRGRDILPKGLYSFEPKSNSENVISAENKALGIAFEEPAFFPVTIVDKRDPDKVKVIEAIHIPLFANEPEGSFGLSGLVPKDLVESREFLEGKDSGKLLLWLARGTQDNLNSAFVADTDLLEFMAQENNATVFNEFTTEGSKDMAWGPKLNRLPKKAQGAFFTLLRAVY